ncbi:uncharacterized protein LACBIDRAFT_317747 [Laccaria bicolor S238N-H82]|uniref:Predicted protein n=1 Tax=Laccaria bicolor (strain S238N-H82 / ATCC MYA-4686) TaxID=486041 RepID=B0E2A4_LACBS|nr:uncharacterized protein LACBIDRAFT_317747 [Laccaria bicolor S238N-H82]EDQ99021.1 predicted protein [Laccaria bicolor S238N-H82]|eukprot:XP_001890329.1 predicted protein [Laccaria bicolor S238N-H82]
MTKSMLSSSRCIGCPEQRPIDNLKFKTNCNLLAYIDTIFSWDWVFNSCLCLFTA